MDAGLTKAPLFKNTDKGLNINHMAPNLPEHIVPINSEQHLNKKLKPVTNFAFAADQHAVSIAVHEFSRCAPIFPIIFLKDNEGTEIKPVSLFGMEKGQNLFVVNGQWGATYIPAILRRYPFVSIMDEEGGRMGVCVDESSGLLNEEEGTPLFTETGEPSEALEKTKRFLGELSAMETFTRQFCEHLNSLDLFRVLSVSYEVQGQKKTLGGCHAIDEKKLQDMDDETFLDLRKKQYLGPIYSHLGSLGQMEKLSHLAARFKKST